MTEPEMTAESPTPLTEDEDTAIFRAIQAAVNYHGFDARLEMADFDVADAIVETRTATSAPGGLCAALESIIAARETALRETIAQAWDEGRKAGTTDTVRVVGWGVAGCPPDEKPTDTPNPYRRQA